MLKLAQAPIKAAFDAAGRADVAAGIKTPEQAASRAQTYANIPIPMLVGALTGGAGLPVQSIAQMETTAAMQEGGLEKKSPAQVVAAGAMPFIAAGLGRLARGALRGATRLIPSRFTAAQQAAQEEAEAVAKGLNPEASAETLFKRLKGTAAPPTTGEVLGPPKPRLALPARGQSSVTGPGQLFEQGQMPEIARVITPSAAGRVPMAGPRGTLEEAAALMRGQPRPYVPMGMPPAQPNIVVETAANTVRPAYPPIGGPGFGVMRHGTLPTAPAVPVKPGIEPIPAANLLRMLDDLEKSIPKNPTSGGLKTAREFMDAAREGIQGEKIPLGELMKLRLDVGQSVGKAPQVAALYKGILADLEQAGAGGGPGARLALSALESARKERGAALMTELIEKSSRGRSALTGEMPLLNISTLSREVQRNKDDLLKYVGAQGLAQIEEFLVKNRALPPVHAYTAANSLINVLGGIGGVMGFGPAGVLGLGANELIKDAFAVGRNPAALNQFLIMLGEGTRAGLGGAAESAVKAKR